MWSLFEDIVSVPAVAGICYTQLYDVECEVNGLLTYDRRLKLPLNAVRDIVSLLDVPFPSSSPPGSDRPVAETPVFKSFIQAGYECSTHKLRNGVRLELVAATQHDRFIGQDYDALLAFGIRTVREGIRWTLIDQGDGTVDFSTVRPFLRAARERGMEIIWDLMHFGWPDRLNIFEAGWVESFERLANEFAHSLKSEDTGPASITPVNEISFLAWAGEDTGYMNPFAKGRGDELKAQLVRAFLCAAGAVRRVLPAARIVSPEPVIHIAGRADVPGDAAHAEAYRMSMFEAWDMILGRVPRDLGGSEGIIDVIGVNFYDRNEWWNFGATIHRSNPDQALRRSPFPSSYNWCSLKRHV